MHELTVTESILEIAVRHAEQAGAARITHLYLVVGQLSSIVDDSVQFYWDLISKHTPAEGAELHFRRIAAQMECRQCQHRYSPDESLACPLCDSTAVRVIAGDEFFLESIEVMQAEEGVPV